MGARRGEGGGRRGGRGGAALRAGRRGRAVGDEAGWVRWGRGGGARGGVAAALPAKGLAGAGWRGGAGGESTILNAEMSGLGSGSCDRRAPGLSKATGSG